MAVDYPNGGFDNLPATLEAAVAGGPEGDGGNPCVYAADDYETLGHMLCNTSGVLVDGNGQVLGQDFCPIPGLFAAGNTAGSRFGIQYTTIYCGANISFAVTQGKFTGEYVASL